MIWIDDSGWGSLIGGVMIGVYDTDSKKFQSRLIPVKYFQSKLFKSGKYRYHAMSAVGSMLSKCTDSEYFYVCRGTVLDGVYNMLSDNYGDKVERLEIKDPLQSMLEERFASYLHKLGVPRNSSGAHCLSFDDQLKWIREDIERVKYVKTGWTSWKLKYAKSK